MWWWISTSQNDNERESPRANQQTTGESCVCCGSGHVRFLVARPRRNWLLLETAAAAERDRGGLAMVVVGRGGGTRAGTTNRKRGDLRFTPAFSLSLRARTISVCAPAYNNLLASELRLLFSCLRAGPRGLGDTDHTKALCALLLTSLYCNQSQLMSGTTAGHVDRLLTTAAPHRTK